MTAVLSRLKSPVAPPLLNRLYALNELHAIELSSLTRDRFEALIAASFVAEAVDDGDGFMLSFDELSVYDGLNFQWFKARYERFVYVDRIAISANRRGEGLAKALYEKLFFEARAAGHNLITCEVNYDPPNPKSDAFHAKLGFEEVGRAVVNGKGVRYLAKRL